MAERIPLVKAEGGELFLGDVIRMNGQSVPLDLRDKYFRVEGLDARGSVQLSQPYLDEALTTLYRPV